MQAAVKIPTSFGGACRNSVLTTGENNTPKMTSVILYKAAKTTGYDEERRRLSHSLVIVSSELSHPGGLRVPRLPKARCKHHFAMNACHHQMQASRLVLELGKIHLAERTCKAVPHLACEE